MFRDRHDSEEGTEAAATERTVFIAKLHCFSHSIHARILFVLAVSAAYAMRRPDMLLHPQLWAEDGLFIKQAHDLGIGSFFQTYANYLHLLPRAVAYVVTRHWLMYAPECFAVASLAGFALVTWRIVSSRLPLRISCTLALAPLAVPHSGEVFLNLVNLQWVTAPLLILLALEPPEQRPRQLVIDMTTVVVLGLTGPFILLFFPIYVLRFVHESGSRYNRGLIAAATLAAVCQGACIALSSTRLAQTSADSPAWAETILQNLVVPLVWPWWQSTSFSASAVLTVLTVLAFAGLAAFAGKMRREILICFYGAIVVAVSGWAVLRQQPQVLHYINGCARYYYIPSVLIFWAMALSLFVTSKRLRAIGALFLVGISISGLMHYQTQGLPDVHWRASVQVYEMEGSVIAPINPNGWVVELHKSEFRSF